MAQNASSSLEITRSPTPSSTTRAVPLRPGSRPLVSGRAPRRSRIAQRHRVGGDRRGGMAARRCPRPAQHAAASARVRSATSGGGSHASRADAASFRDRAYLRDVDEIAPGIIEMTESGRRHPRLPLVRAVWLDDDLPHASARRRVPGRARTVREPRGRLRRPVHVGQPRRAEGHHSHARRRAAHGCLEPGSARGRSRRSPLHPDAVLLDRRPGRGAAQRARCRARRCSRRPSPMRNTHSISSSRNA